MTKEATNSQISAAIDIGYSSVKIVFGSATGKPKSITLPAGAGPTSLLPRSISSTSADYPTVQINGEPWAAGVDPTKLDGWSRELHANYPSTDQYMALFLAALLVTGAESIDHLVTGLPVSQAHDKARVEALRTLLAGDHQVTEKRKITVKKVSVLPQPVGAWLDYVTNQATDAELPLLSSRVLVIDPGFFSFDWTVIEDGEMRSAYSGTSTAAMSATLEEANRLIAIDNGNSVGRDKLDRALREGNSAVFIYGQQVEIADYIEKAAATTARKALIDVQQNLRLDTQPYDAILLAGGGAKIYAGAAQQIYPHAKILTAKDTVCANARGFWSYAQ
jgi:plasmid segregation protein ParM